MFGKYKVGIKQVWTKSRSNHVVVYHPLPELIYEKFENPKYFTPYHLFGEKQQKAEMRIG